MTRQDLRVLDACTDEQSQNRMQEGGDDYSARNGGLTSANWRSHTTPNAQPVSDSC